MSQTHLVQVLTWTHPEEHRSDFYLVPQDLYEALLAFIDGKSPTDWRITNCLNENRSDLPSRENRERIASGLTIKFGRTTSVTTWSQNQY